MATIIYNYKKSDVTGALTDELMSFRIKVYKDKISSYTKTVRIPKDMKGKKKIKEFIKAEVDKFDDECKNPTPVAEPSLPLEPLTPTFAEYAKIACDNKRKEKIIKDSTYARYIEFLKRINDEFGNKAIDSIRRSDIKSFYHKLLAKDSDPEIEETLKRYRNQKNGELLSAKTIKEHIQLISSIFEAAIDDEIITANPARRIKCVTPELDPRCLQIHEVEKTLEHIETESLKWKTMTLMLLGTGCRRGEIAGLKKESIDWENGILCICSNLLVDKGMGVYETSTKSQSSKRFIPITKELIHTMREYLDEQNVRKEAYGDKWVDSPYFFTQENGDRMHPDSITDFFDKFSGSHDDLPHIYPHMFRHTYASFLIAEKVDIVTIANLMGHKDATVTLKVYAQMMKKAQAMAQMAVNAKISSLISVGKKEESENNQ